MKDNMKYVLREIFEEAVDELLAGGLRATEERIITIELVRNGNITFRLNKDAYIMIDCTLELLKEDKD